MKKITLIMLNLMLSASLFAQTSGFFDEVNYKGAFGSSNWLKGWTALDHYGYLAPATTSSSEVTVTDGDINSGEVVYWTADKTYILDGFVYVEDGAVLNIEAGTVIKGKTGQGESASALVIAQGGKIYAEGTSTSPIIFTGESDDVNNPNDLPLPTSNLWGGLIILGKAQINTTIGVGNIEGLPVSEKSQYGGEDDHDNSGVLRYISIRHGGTDIGSGNEINGLTLGGVGDGTTIEYIEVFNNNDDGYEWFGGTVNCKYLVSVFNGDDAFDHDEGLRSKMQFLFAIQDSEMGGHLGEHDGGTVPEDGEPYAFPQIYNATFLGSGVSSTNPDNSNLFNLRDFWGGLYNNSIFGDFRGDAMKVEDLATGNDSRLRLENGQIVFKNNVWFDFGAGSTFAELGNHEWEAAYLSDAANGNTIENPGLKSINRMSSTASLDPRPTAGGAAYQNLAAIVSVENISFEDVNPADFALNQNYPNPFNPSTVINFELKSNSNISLKVYNVLGAEVATLANGNYASGKYNVTFDASKLSSGVYFYRLQAGNFIETKKMVLIK